MSQDARESFASRVEALRVHLGLTQKALATAAGLGVEVVSKLESGAHKGRSHTVRRGLAAASALPYEAVDAYLDGHIDLATALSRRSVSPLPPPARAASRVTTRETADSGPEAQRSEEFETALLRAIDPDRFVFADIDAAREAFRETHWLLASNVDLVALARAFLVAARELRRDGKPTNPSAITARVASANASGGAPSDVALNASIDALAREQGVEPGQGAEALAALAARAKRSPGSRSR